jgi:hypothetical protein
MREPAGIGPAEGPFLPRGRALGPSVHEVQRKKVKAVHPRRHGAVVVIHLPEQRMREGIEGGLQRQRPGHSAMFGDACVVMIHRVIGKAGRAPLLLARFEVAHRLREVILESGRRFIEGENRIPSAAIQSRFGVSFGSPPKQPMESTLKSSARMRTMFGRSPACA